MICINQLFVLVFQSMRGRILILSIILGIITAVFETFGALGAGYFWEHPSKRWLGLIVIIFGFGGSIFTYVMMRKFITDLSLGQAIFISGTALFAVISSVIINRSINWQIILGLLSITLGVLIINQVLPE